MADTMHLSEAEDGVYLRLLMCAWRMEGTLPDDDARLARFARVALPRWKKVYRPVMEPFFLIENGQWVQKRLKKEWDFVAQRGEISRANGTRGGRPKSLKTANQPNPSGSSQDNLEGTRTETTHPHTHNLPTNPPVILSDDIPPVGGGETVSDALERETGPDHPVEPESQDPEPEEPIPKNKRAHRLPEGWTPSPAGYQLARDHGLWDDEIELLLAEYRDYWAAEPGSRGRKLDWEATFRNRVRARAADIIRRRGAPAGPAPRGNGREPSGFVEGLRQVVRRASGDDALP